MCCTCETIRREEGPPEKRPGAVFIEGGLHHVPVALLQCYHTTAGFSSSYSFFLFVPGYILTMMQLLHDVDALYYARAVSNDDHYITKGGSPLL